MKQQSEYEAELNREIARRVDYLEKNVDMETSGFSRGNWIMVAVAAAGSLALFIWGLFA